MIYIQRVRNNDIGNDYGKQVELGKVFMSYHNWETGEIPVSITFCAVSEDQKPLNGTTLKTSFKVRGDERGGDRMGMDCKEYANNEKVCILKQFLTDKLHLTPNEDFFILEDIGKDGQSFKLYGIKSKDIPAGWILEKFRGQVIDMEEALEPIKLSRASNEPLQLIYYGAPGTGKSFTIDKETDEDNSVRTTFHPDSDYAGFVGAYKPTMQEVDIHYISEGEVKYAKGADNDKANKGVHPGKEKKIVYKYVPQAFLKAYVEAWSRYSPYEDNPYYLVIEEINRGNCAQIFGDLFQLLDRNNTGSSSYAINADEDIAQFLRDDENGFNGFSEEQKETIRKFILKKDSGKEELIGESILNGSKLLLPPNLRIWATMNTSDQSLFPIDSAFKRRWNWEYMPIEYDKKDWTFEVGDKRYSWGSFLKYINPKILEITQSEDKQMGYFFAKPDKKSKDSLEENDVISTKVFVNKVLFYLWTDVFKDYDLTQEPFVYEDKDDDRKKSYRFTDFFPINDNQRLIDFVKGMNLEEVLPEDIGDEESDGSKVSLGKFKVKGRKVDTITWSLHEILSPVVGSMTFDEFSSRIKEFIPRTDREVFKTIEDAKNYTKENGWLKYPLTTSDGVSFVITNQWKKEFIPMVKALADNLGVEFEQI